MPTPSGAAPDWNSQLSEKINLDDLPVIEEKDIHRYPDLVALKTRVEGRPLEDPCCRGMQAELKEGVLYVREDFLKLVFEGQTPVDALDLVNSFRARLLIANRMGWTIDEVKAAGAELRALFGITEVDNY